MKKILLTLPVLVCAVLLTAQVDLRVVGAFIDGTGAVRGSITLPATGSLFTGAAGITAGSGTGITVNNAGEFRETAYKVTIDEAAFLTAGVTSDVTIATLPAKTLLTGIVADLTEVFACSSVCTSATLSIVVGRGAGGNEFLASFDADAATAVFGDADGELGTTMARAAAVQAGSPEAWASTQAVVMRLTSATGNIGDGALNTLSTGNVTVYLTAKVLP